MIKQAFSGACDKVLNNIENLFDVYGDGLWKYGDRAILKQSVIHDRMDIIDWALCKGCPIKQYEDHKKIVDEACDVLEVHDVFSDEIIDCLEPIEIAAYYGRFDMMKRFHDLDKESVNDYTLFGAAKGGHIEIIKYVIDSGCEPYPHMLRYAIYGKQLEVLKWACENKMNEHLSRFMKEFINDFYDFDIAKWILEEKRDLIEQIDEHDKKMFLWKFIPDVAVNSTKTDPHSYNYMHHFVDMICESAFKKKDLKKL